MPAPAAERPDRHYFVINQEGKSAHRRGPFATAAAAREWAAKFYRFPCWIIPAEYAGVVEHRPLTEKGEQAATGVAPRHASERET